MKKLLGSTLALALFLPAGAHAEMLKNLKLNGSLEVDAVSANNATDLDTAKYDHLGTAQTRVMLNADWDLLDDVHAKVTLNKNNRAYGTASENLNGIQTAVTVEQAYLKIDKLFGALDTTIGRQFYGDAGDLVIYYGPKMALYGLPVTALDGGRFDWNGEKVGVTALVAKLTGSAVGTNDNANVNLQGLKAMIKPMDGVSASVYGYHRTTVNSIAGANTQNVRSPDNLYVVGLKGKATMGGAWAKAEVAKDFGELRPNGVTGNTNYSGWAGLADLGYKLDLSNVGALTGWAEGGVGSGGAANHTFTAIAGDYRPGSIYGRFAAGSSAVLNNANTSLGTNTLADRVVFGAGVKLTPAMLTKLTAGLSWWNLRHQTANNLSAAAAGNKFIGNEYDLDLTWAHSENVSVSAGVGTFQPGNFVKATQGVNSPATLGYTDFSVKF